MPDSLQHDYALKAPSLGHVKNHTAETCNLRRARDNFGKLMNLDLGVSRSEVSSAEEGGRMLSRRPVVVEGVVHHCAYGCERVSGRWITS